MGRANDFYRFDLFFSGQSSIKVCVALQDSGLAQHDILKALYQTISGFQERVAGRSQSSENSKPDSLESLAFASLINSMGLNASYSFAELQAAIFRFREPAATIAG
jgi:hypothetical protein